MYLPSSPTPLTHSGTEVPSPLPIRELRSHLHYLFGHWGLISIIYLGTEVPSPLSIWALRSYLHYLFGHWGPIYITNSGTEVPSPLPIQALRSHLHYQCCSLCFHLQEVYRMHSAMHVCTFAHPRCNSANCAGIFCILHIKGNLLSDFVGTREHIKVRNKK